MSANLSDSMAQLIQDGYGYDGALDSIRSLEYDRALKGIFFNYFLMF